MSGGEADARPALGVCSWSLQPASCAALIDRVRACGLDAVQLALDPIRLDVEGESWGLERTREALGEAGISVVSGMLATAREDYSSLETIAKTGGVRPDDTWEENLASAREVARIARSLGLGLVTFHAGFLPHDPVDPERTGMIERLRAIIDLFGDEGVRIGFESGQESANTLLGVLEQLERPSAGVNFDPANMILYGMGDPVEALESLAPRVAQIHIKDARPATTPGTWGEEVVVGTGGVDWDAFFRLVRERCAGVDLLIEREAGDSRVDDIRAAAALVGPMRA